MTLRVLTQAWRFKHLPHQPQAHWGEGGKGEPVFEAPPLLELLTLGWWLLPCLPSKGGSTQRVMDPNSQIGEGL